MILWFIFVRKPNSAILMHRRIFLPQKNDNERCCKIHINNPLTFIMLFIFLWGLRVVRWVRRKQLTCPQPSLSCVMSPMSMREKGKEREYSPVLYNLSVLSWLSKILCLKGRPLCFYERSEHNAWAADSFCFLNLPRTNIIHWLCKSLKFGNQQC